MGRLLVDIAPPLDPVDLLEELMRKGPRPLAPLLADVGVDDASQLLPVTVELVAGRLIDEGDDADTRERAHEDLCRLRDVVLGVVQLVLVTRGQEHLTDLRDKARVDAMRDVRALRPVLGGVDESELDEGARHRAQLIGNKGL